MHFITRWIVAGSLAFTSMISAFSSAEIYAQSVPKPVQVSQLKLKDLSGRWTGVGDMSFRDGTKEHIKCRIVYRSRSIRKLIQKIWCKNRNIRLEVQAEIIDKNGRLSGSWDDRVYSMSGQLRGQLKGNQLKASLAGGFFNAKLNISVIGRRQTIQFTPDQGQLRSMQLRLARG